MNFLSHTEGFEDERSRKACVCHWVAKVTGHPGRNNRKSEEAGRGSDWTPPLLACSPFFPLSYSVPVVFMVPCH